MNHTPGPWYVDLRGPQEFPLHVAAKDSGRSLALICRTPEDERDANARIIAAAPDMLEACKFIDLCQNCDESDVDSNIEKAKIMLKAAIAKAEEDQGDNG